MGWREREAELRSLFSPVWCWGSVAGSGHGSSTRGREIEGTGDPVGFLALLLLFPPLPLPLRPPPELGLVLLSFVSCTGIGLTLVYPLPRAAGWLLLFMSAECLEILP